METIKNILKLLNQKELFVVQSGIEYDTFVSIRRVLIDEFSDIDLDKLVEILDIIDNLHLDFLKKKF